MNGLRPPLLAGVLILGGVAAFIAGSAHWALAGPPKRAFDVQIQAVPPPPAAVAMAFGDPYLAADLATVKALVSAANLAGKEEKAALARLLDLTLILNPAQEDAYYLAEAMLPWQGRVARAQRLLRRAEQARPWDYLPPFFRAFNRYYFQGEPVAGARILRRAADRRGPERAARLRAMAGRWAALGREPEQALELVTAMAKGVGSVGSKALRRNLKMRAQQLRRLIRLREAAAAYRKAEGQDPPSVEALAGHGPLEAVPEDPTGDGYIVDEDGEVHVRPPNFDRVRTPSEGRNS